MDRTSRRRAHAGRGRASRAEPECIRACRASLGLLERVFRLGFALALGGLGQHDALHLPLAAKALVLGVLAALVAPVEGACPASLPRRASLRPSPILQRASGEARVVVRARWATRMAPASLANNEPKPIAMITTATMTSISVKPARRGLGRS